MSPLRLFCYLLLLACCAHAQSLLQGREAHDFVGPMPLLVRAERIGTGPVIHPGMMPSAVGENINGPSLIRVPEWVERPLGRYYLYFAHHRDDHIRMAYADDPEGPFTLLEGGVLHLDEQTALRDHLASPDVVVDAENRRIVMFYHGSNLEDGKPQMTATVVSSDGIHFTPVGGVVAPAYLRVFRWDGQWFGITHAGVLLRTAAPGQPFVPIGRLFGREIAAALDPARLGEPGAKPVMERPQGGKHRYGIRHVGVDVFDDNLVIYFSCVGHRPERIFCTLVKLHGPPESWRAQGIAEVLRPETEWEGADLPLEYSEGGIAIERVRQLRDPQGYREGERAWLLYTVAGEHGIGMARLSYVPMRSNP